MRGSTSTRSRLCATGQSGPQIQISSGAAKKWPTIQYAPVHSFVEGERVPQAEEIPVAGEGEDEDDEPVDEEIEADAPPESATGTAAESTAEKASTEIPASPSATKAPDSDV